MIYGEVFAEEDKLLLEELENEEEKGTMNNKLLFLLKFFGVACVVAICLFNMFAVWLPMLITYHSWGQIGVLIIEPNMTIFLVELLVIGPTGVIMSILFFKKFIDDNTIK